MNQHEQAARLMKVFRLSAALERLARSTGFDSPDGIADFAELEMTQAQWDGLAAAARVNPPSEETIRLVVLFFRERATQAAADPFEGLPA